METFVCVCVCGGGGGGGVGGVWSGALVTQRPHTLS